MAIKVKTVKECKNCHITNKEVTLYYCRRHKNFFCRECLISKKRDPRFTEVQHCHGQYFLGEFFNARAFNEIEHNCIYEMIPVLEEEATA
jgi:hypothetical protein